MSPSAKLHFGSAGYCAFLVGLNWFRSVEYSRQVGVMREVLAPIVVAALIALAVAVYLVYRCVRTAAARLESGQKVGEGGWIESWSIILYAVPLLFHRTSTSKWIEPDGSLVTATGGYGHALSPWVFGFAIAGLLSFQILMRLDSGDEEAEPEPQPTLVSRRG
jgi:hypothetical protein